MAEQVYVLYALFDLPSLQTLTYCDIYRIDGSFVQTNTLAVDSSVVSNYIPVVFNTLTNKAPVLEASALLAVQPYSSVGSAALDLTVNNSATALASGFQTDNANIWWASSTPDVMWGLHRFGSESSGSPYARDAASLVQWRKSGGVWGLAHTIYPFATIGGAVYDYGMIAGAVVAPAGIAVLGQPNTDQDTHFQLSCTVYDWNMAAVLRSGIIDATQGNGVGLGGGPGHWAANSDGSVIVYFHYGGAPYVSKAWFARINTGDLSVVASPTPAAASAPPPWDETGTVHPPFLTNQATGVLAVSRTGKYVFGCENTQGNAAPNAYAYFVWNTETNAINYRQSLALVTGFTGANYIPIPIPGGYMSLAWDSDDHLWMVIERTDASFDLLRFSLSGTDIVQDLRVPLPYATLSAGNNPTLLVGPASSGGGSTPPLPPVGSTGRRFLAELGPVRVSAVG